MKPYSKASLFIGFLLFSFQLPIFATERMTPNGVEGNGSTIQITTSTQRIAFVSNASNFVSGDNNGKRDVFLYEPATNAIRRVSVAASEADGDSSIAMISADGRFVVFESEATNLVAGDDNRAKDIFLYDIDNDSLTLISAGLGGGTANAASSFPSISDDGRFVSFSSYAKDLVANDTNSRADVFLYDRLNDSLQRVSLGGSGVEADGNSTLPFISGNGQYVSFVSTAKNLVVGDNNGKSDIFVYELATASLERVSVASNGSEANSYSTLPMMSRDGRYVAYLSNASNLVSDDSNNSNDIFVYDRVLSTSERVSLGDNDQQADGNSFSPSISADGRYVSFASYAENLVTNDKNTVADMFLRDRERGKTLLISETELGSSANAASIARTSFSGDNRYISFVSYASDLVANDNNNVPDVFTRRIYANQAPLADAGEPQELECSGTNNYATLDGSGSSDPDGDSLSFTWTGSFGTESGSLVQVPLELGEHAITLDIDDGNEGSDSDTLIITVSDTIAPVIEAQSPASFEASSAQGVQYLLDYSVSDSCAMGETTVSPELEWYPLGSTQVTITSLDSVGNESSAQIEVQVKDTTAPELTIPADIQIEASATLTPVEIGSATASDYFLDSVTHNASANGFSLGATAVTWTAIDSSGNKSEAVQTITVVDTTAPEIKAIGDVLIEAESELTAYSLSTPDVNEIFLTSLVNNAPQDGYPLGVTEVVWTATDSSQNSSSYTQRVEVQDTTAPVLTVPADVRVEASGINSIVDLGIATASDIYAIEISNDAPADFPVGATTVTWKAVDANGNSTSASQRVEVVDTTAPVATITQLKETIWPPNRKMVHVLDLENVFDVTTPVPSVNFSVSAEDPLPEHHSKKGHKHEEDSESAADEDESSWPEKAGRYVSHHGKRIYDRLFNENDWKVVEENGKWQLWVRAEIIGHARERIYTINVSIVDNYTNMLSQQYLVEVKHEEHKKKDHKGKGHKGKDHKGKGHKGKDHKGDKPKHSQRDGSHSR